MSHDQTAQILSSRALSTLTMDVTLDETVTAISAAIDVNYESQTAQYTSPVDTLSTFTIDVTLDVIEDSLSSEFNYEFSSTLVLDVQIEPSFSRTVGTFNPNGKPIIFYERDVPIIFYENSVDKAIIFHKRGIVLTFLNESSDIEAPYSLESEEVPKRIFSVIGNTALTMDDTLDNTDTGLSASFNTSVA